MVMDWLRWFFSCVICGVRCAENNLRPEPQKGEGRLVLAKTAQPGQDWASFLRWLAKCVYFAGTIVRAPNGKATLSE